ncbi:hypothetical protein M0802_015511 [Mischocyttarus mexicanus]|nr:hypothetical protein M0802_015513 [Mischocyttarus mexicanus]KAI4474650.1 hypothetical protein M0802_015511 [Mischocyttarus mexicanus]
MISSASNKYSHLMSIGLGCSGGIIYYFISRLIFYNDLEDHCNIIAIHLIYGLLANVLAPFCISEENSTIKSCLLNLSWQLICLIVLMGLVTVTLTPLLLILNTFGILKHRSQIFKVNESTISLETTKGSSDKNITYNKYEESIINNTNLLSIKFTGENSDQSQNELSRLEKDEFIEENYLNKIVNMKNEESSDPSQSSGRKVHKLRQIYTLSGYNLISSQNQFANGDMIDIDLTNSRKYFSETNLQYSSNDSQSNSKEIQNRLNLSCHVDTKDNGDNEITIKNQLRRTQKFMNLREELDKQEIR